MKKVKKKKYLVKVLWYTDYHVCQWMILKLWEENKRNTFKNDRNETKEKVMPSKKSDKRKIIS